MSIATDILNGLKAKVKRAAKEGKAEDFYLDEVDREAIKALIAISERDKPLPKKAQAAADRYNLR
mgnify:CR=1 FL=1